MDKLEKAIKAWKCCHPFNRQCDKCPYDAECYHDGFCRDAISDMVKLLKEQNSLMLALDQSNSANEYLNEEVDKLNALLRQQQDEIAMLTKKAKSPTWRRGKAFCGSCGGCLENKEKHSADIVSSIRFCKWCGTPVDWSNE